MLKAFFDIEIGPAEWGSAEYTLRLGEDSWRCTASYIGLHPLNQLIHSAVDLYNHIFELPLPEESAIWECWALDEPGGILLRVTSEGRKVKITVYYSLMDDFVLGQDRCPDISAVAECLIDYWEYAEAIYRAAAQVILKQGFVGLRSGWRPGYWDADNQREVLPVERFFYLAALVRHRAPRPVLGLAEEIAILSAIAEEVKS